MVTGGRGPCACCLPGAGGLSRLISPSWACPPSPPALPQSRPAAATRYPYLPCTSPLTHRPVPSEACGGRAQNQALPAGLSQVCELAWAPSPFSEDIGLMPRLPPSCPLLQGVLRWNPNVTQEMRVQSPAHPKPNHSTWALALPTLCHPHPPAGILPQTPGPAQVPPPLA